MTVWCVQHVSCHVPAHDTGYLMSFRSGAPLRISPSSNFVGRCCMIHRCTMSKRMQETCMESIFEAHTKHVLWSWEKQQMNISWCYLTESWLQKSVRESAKCALCKYSKRWYWSNNRNGHQSVFWAIKWCKWFLHPHPVTVTPWFTPTTNYCIFEKLDSF